MLNFRSMFDVDKKEEWESKDIIDVNDYTSVDGPVTQRVFVQHIWETNAKYSNLNTVIEYCVYTCDDVRGDELT